MIDRLGDGGARAKLGKGIVGGWCWEDRGVHASAQDGERERIGDDGRSTLKTTLKNLTIVIKGMIGLGEKGVAEAN